MAFFLTTFILEGLLALDLTHHIQVAIQRRLLLAVFTRLMVIVLVDDDFLVDVVSILLDVRRVEVEILAHCLGVIKPAPRPLQACIQAFRGRLSKVGAPNLVLVLHLLGDILEPPLNYVLVNLAPLDPSPFVLCLALGSEENLVFFV